MLVGLGGNRTAGCADALERVPITAQRTIPIVTFSATPCAQRPDLHTTIDPATSGHDTGRDPNTDLMAMRVCPLCGETTKKRRCPKDDSDTFRRVAMTRHQIMDDTVIDGRYHIGGVIGKGGFGTVYGGRDLRTGQELAIKVLTTAHSGTDARVVQRFVHEAAITARLTHGNTVRVFDFGQTADGELFLVMERLHGRSLRKQLDCLQSDGRKMEPAEAIRIGTGVLQSLSQAHAKGLVHRDLKPENIYLHEVARRVPIIKVLDFGVVKSNTTGMTLAGEIVGTPTHMAPEQVREMPIDGRCDLYSLGIVLYECICGSLPFEAVGALQLLMMHVQTPPPPLAERAPGTPKALIEVVDKALAKEPDDRWPDANAMRQALVAINQTLRPRRPTTTKRRLPTVLSATPLAQRRSPRAPGTLVPRRKAGSDKKLHLASTQPVDKDDDKP